MSNDKLLPWFFEANDKIIKTAGGKDKYESLCQEEKDVLLSAMMQKLIIEFGQDACEEVADNEKWISTLFIWAVVATKI